MPVLGGFTERKTGQIVHNYGAMVMRAGVSVRCDKDRSRLLRREE